MWLKTDEMVECPSLRCISGIPLIREFPGPRALRYPSGGLDVVMEIWGCA